MDILIRYGRGDTPFGEMMLAEADGMLCHAGFTRGDFDATLARLRAEWPDAAHVRDDTCAGQWRDRLFGGDGTPADVPVRLRGTPFQRDVWDALMRIPHGSTTTYSQLAAAIGRPRAARAVGSAVGANPVAVWIPCHRVVRRDGGIGGYAYGTDIKAALLKAEISTASDHPTP
jgi:AraC family transcriptional regulator, regulatory protein of adaptative response / methylated-DNA-[protein]-cysteine methyltransferase